MHIAYQKPQDGITIGSIHSPESTNEFVFLDASASSSSVAALDLNAAQDKQSLGSDLGEDLLLY
ncbi:MAG: hypothetical protein IPG59_01635 [Candidatus Melainabacteria bacterium]|nr:MAG: hypothetical protein IPG59_01635 [Candidatus Melainabacteria bacterium]